MHRIENGSRRIAFFGGSFDPPHLGHLAVARAAREALCLDTVLFAPVGVQPLKRDLPATSFADRLAMTELAISSQTGFAVSLVDAPRASATLGFTTSSTPNYTIYTLLELRASLPPGGSLFCLMGADSFLGLRQWRRGAEIPLVAPLIVASRPGQQLGDLEAALPAGLTIESAPAGEHLDCDIEVQHYRLRNLAGESAPFYLLPGLHVEVSASEIRDQVRAASGEPAHARELLPAAVSDYIRSHGLYR
jgi:nicotinate-nucleotide adenylyltransferase